MRTDCAARHSSIATKLRFHGEPVRHWQSLEANDAVRLAPEDTNRNTADHTLNPWIIREKQGSEPYFE